MTQRLRLWGVTHAQARAAEAAARQQGPDAPGELRRDAQALRDRADRLHREIYRQLDRKPQALDRTQASDRPRGGPRG